MPHFQRGDMWTAFATAICLLLQPTARFVKTARWLWAAALPDKHDYLARHAQRDWGELDVFDRHQNDTAVKEGYRILSAYAVPVGDGKTERIWIITESDRSANTVLLPSVE